MRREVEPFATLAPVIAWAFKQSPPAELLDSRLARGWVPSPTATREGNVVLGYAACRTGISGRPRHADR